MAKRIALRAFLLANLAIALAYGSAFLPGGAPSWAAWVLAFAIPAVLVGAMVIGAARDGRVGRLVWPFALVFVLVAGGFALLLALPPADPADPTLWLGLPPRAAVLLFGIGLLPVVVVPFAYAATFDEMTLSDSDLERVVEAARARRAAVPVAAGGGDGADGAGGADLRGGRDGVDGEAS